MLPSTGPAMNRIILPVRFGKYLEGGSRQHVKQLPYCFCHIEQGAQSKKNLIYAIFR